MSESLRVIGQPDPKYVMGTRICVACMALETARAERAADDEEQLERGVHPDAWRLDHVELLADALARLKSQKDERR